MIRFNYVLLIFDIIVIIAPYFVAEYGFYSVSTFLFGFLLMWIYLNIVKKKINLKRYKLF